MDKRLLVYYNRELAHLRQMGGEFAQAFPKVAGRLALTSEDCADPYVERLLEGFAFLAARVHLKLDAEFPRFTQSLLETVYPHYLAPTPSMAIIQFQPAMKEAGLVEGFPIRRGTALHSVLGKGEQTPCEYRTAHNITLWPVKVVEAQYHTRDLSAFEPRRYRDARAGIRIRLQTAGEVKFSALKLDNLAIYLRGSDETPMRIYEQLFARAMGVLVQPPTRPARWKVELPAGAVRQVGFDDDQKLLPYDARSFQGYRLLHEYFAFPQRYMFFELAGLGEAIKQCDGNQLDIVILLREPNLLLENNVDASHFALFCTPAINLFPKTADQIEVTDRFSEFHVVADRTRPRDFEVYQVQSVIGYGARMDEGQEFRPFYAATDTDASGGAYYSVSREQRVQSEREKQFGRRSSYVGSEVFISLVDAVAAPYRTDLQQLAVKTLCTNRDLPLHLPPSGTTPTDFNMSESAPWESIRYLKKTSPQPSHVEGSYAWRVISHLALNYLSLADTEGGDAAGALKSLLQLYSDPADPGTTKQIEGLRAVSSKPIVRRVATAGPIAFARGLEVNVTLDPTSFEGTGIFLLGAVLERFFAKHVSINSFTETVVHSVERGHTAEVMRWPARVGRRQTL